MSHDIVKTRTALVTIAADPRWSCETHSRFPSEFREIVKSLLILNLCTEPMQDHRNPFAVLPKELVLYLIAILAINY